MPDATAAAPRSARPRIALPAATVLAFVLAATAIVSLGVTNYEMQRGRSAAADSLRNTLETISRLEGVVSSLRDAETGQRGYLLTGAEPYLEPYQAAKAAVATQFAAARDALASNPRQLERLGLLAGLSQEKLAELDATIALHRAGRVEDALATVRSNRGKNLMDRIRQHAAEIEGDERQRADQRRDEWNSAVARSVTVTWGGSAVLLLLVALAAFMMARDHRRREEEAWIRAGQLELADRLRGDPRVEQLGERALDLLARRLDAQVAAFYACEPDGMLRRIAGFACAGDPKDAPRLAPGQGLLGEAARSTRRLHVRKVPPGHLDVQSSLGHSRPSELLLVAARADGRLEGVLEFGFFHRVEAVDGDFLDRAAESVAIGLRAARDRSRLEELLEETQRQSEELQTQQEELRVTNEELEEQGRVLRESQMRLENQQSELEETNAQLEEQARALEQQRDELERTQQALTTRAAEVERASRYKSQFLANMSHELRTPLNSTLILAKLLADNKDGNLTAGQVKFAQTIQSAGNDLLTLINDILDLSKIEAGKMELNLSPVVVAPLLQNLHQQFEPIAKARGLRLVLDIAPDVPASVQTDELRCGQILKNLLSNAIKFTGTGEVVLQASVEAGLRQLRLAVRDTGIGIAPEQQHAVFDAFTQADGSTHRKYGGTGLGLAISRQLAQLLGGEIALHSVPGAGSVFTLVLPFDASTVTARPAAGATPLGAGLPAGDAFDSLPATTTNRARQAAGQAAAAAARRADARMAGAAIGSAGGAAEADAVEDDRGRLGTGARLILVVEDDRHFAAILRDLVHESAFQCVITHSASAGLDAAQRYRPDAILLDVHLPDHSGLGVLDQLKRNPETRHIPVHMISVADHSQDALQMGAIGYAIKPVDRDQLADALKRLDAKFSQTLRRVLVVEDDARQRESIGELLAGDGVEIVGVQDAASALEALHSTTFDCMVMDLSLPDMSGYELLERMAREDSVAFPPVIVYTGRSLTTEQEQQLQRFSHAIIIKGARSPERLLAEVTLFLHQVETRLPPDRQRMLKEARNHEEALAGRRVLVVEDDVRNVFALSAVLEPKGMAVAIARNGLEALQALERSATADSPPIDLVLMDIMMPEMDGYTAMREIRKRPEWRKLPIIALTAKAMADDQENCLAAGANDYIAKPLDVEKLLSLVRVWMPK